MKAQEADGLDRAISDDSGTKGAQAMTSSIVACSMCSSPMLADRVKDWLKCGKCNVVMSRQEYFESIARADNHEYY